MYNNDYVGIGSFNIFVGVFVATIFGAAFFFDLFWPERTESRAVKRAWRVRAAVYVYRRHAARVCHGRGCGGGRDVAAGVREEQSACVQAESEGGRECCVLVAWDGVYFYQVR
jgi:hypothetical protein